MATTRTAARPLVLGSLVVATAALSACAIWVKSRGQEEGAGVPFWRVLSSTAHSSEKNPPATVDEAVKRSDAVVVAHVVGVTKGRVFKGWLEPAPHLPLDPATTMVNVQLAVDRVVAGSVNGQQTLNWEVFPPPAPVTLEQMQASLPSGQVLLFLGNRAADGTRAGFGPLVQPEDANLWWQISDRAVIAQGPAGLYTPLVSDDPAVPQFLGTFGATTLAGAADRAATTG